MRRRISATSLLLSTSGTQTSMAKYLIFEGRTHIDGAARGDLNERLGALVQCIVIGFVKEIRYVEFQARMGTDPAFGEHVEAPVRGQQRRIRSTGVGDAPVCRQQRASPDLRI